MCLFLHLKSLSYNLGILQSDWVELGGQFNHCATCSGMVLLILFRVPLCKILLWLFSFFSFFSTITRLRTKIIIASEFNK